MLSPAWSASIVHVPTVSRVTSVPATVHTDVVVELKATVRPDEAVAAIVTGESARVLFARGPNVIAWLFSAAATAKLWVTCGAALQLASPAWSAAMVQVPAARSESAPVAASTKQMPEVVEL